MTSDQTSWATDADMVEFGKALFRLGRDARGPYAQMGDRKHRFDARGRLRLKERLKVEWRGRIPDVPPPSDEAINSAIGALRQLAEAEEEGLDDVLGGEDDEDEGASQADLIYKWALEAYLFLRSDDGRCYALPKKKPNLKPFNARYKDGGIAIPLGKKLAGKLLQLYHANTEKIPQPTAASSAIAMIESQLGDADPLPVRLRAAWHSGRVILDLGGPKHGPKASCIVAGPAGWEVASRAPVIFRRSGTMLPMPKPVRGETRDSRLLRDLLNCDEPTYRLVVGYILAAWIERIAHPILAFSGEQGSAKSMAAAIITGLISPDSVPLRSVVKDEEQWAVCAYASYCFAIDNLSFIEPWLSDALCKAATGGGLLKRTLYENDAVTALVFRRVILLTGLDLGGAPGDLTERILPVHFEPIDAARRRTEYTVIGSDDTGVMDDFIAARPAILGMLLDLLCEALAAMPKVDRDDLPRMADFGIILRALDHVTGWETASDYDFRTGNATAALLEGSPFGAEIQKLIRVIGTFEGTVTDLLTRLKLQMAPQGAEHPGKPPRGWPSSPQQAGVILTRIAPSLRKVGIDVAQDRTRASRMLRISRAGGPLSPLSPGPDTRPLPAETAVTTDPRPLSPDGNGVVTTVTTDGRQTPSVTTEFGPVVTAVPAGQTSFSGSG